MSDPKISYCNFVRVLSKPGASFFVVSEDSLGYRYSADHLIMVNNAQNVNGGKIECYSSSLFIDKSVILGKPGSATVFYTDNGKIIITNSIVDDYTLSSSNGVFEKTNVSRNIPNG